MYWTLNGSSPSQQRFNVSISLRQMDGRLVRLQRGACVCLHLVCVSVCLCARWSLQPKHLVYALALAPGRRSVDRKEKKETIGEASKTWKMNLAPEFFWISRLRQKSWRVWRWRRVGGGAVGRREGLGRKKKRKMHSSETVGYWKL